GSARAAGAERMVLDGGDRVALRAYLLAQGWIDDAEVVELVEPAGPGNMNLVLRVVTARRSLVVKQGRPFVARYPHLAAPPGRTLVEAEWYALVGERPDLASRLPRLLGVDPASQVLVLSDLGPAADFTGVYTGDRLDTATLDALVGWLCALHRGFHDDDGARRIENAEMRRLNHEHVFELPLRPDNGVDLDALTPGLSKLAEPLRRDRGLRSATSALGAAYFGPGTTLLHGDYYPGSWLKGPGGPFVVDPEFGFFGPPEFDLGVMLAHLELSDQPADVADRALGAYLAEATAEVDLVWAFCGVEVIRRLLGVAQLPLSAGLAEKGHLLEVAATRVRKLG
ncbi:MAG: phosphotransferase, partial [Acidimicrobiales bacterium]